MEQADVEALVKDATTIAKGIGAGDANREDIISEALLAVAGALHDGVDFNEAIRRVRVACRSELRRLWGYANRRESYPDGSDDGDGNEIDSGNFDPEWICWDRKQNRGPVCAWFPLEQFHTPESAVREAIGKLSRKLQDVLELTYWFGYEEDEVAEILAVSPSAVHDRLNRARKKLQKILSANPTFLRPSLRIVIEGERQSDPNSTAETSEPLEKAA
jgi:RNA polymerase sigma factor (sigma-70 family)